VIPYKMVGGAVQDSTRAKKRESVILDRVGCRDRKSKEIMMEIGKQRDLV
jgi:hypothetical protein